LPQARLEIAVTRRGIKAHLGLVRGLLKPATQEPSMTIFVSKPPTPLTKVLTGLPAIQYASQHPGTVLHRRALLTGRLEPITLEVAYWLSQRGAEGQVFVALNR
jgi:hypothetical protein